MFDLEAKLKIETDPAKREAYLQRKFADDDGLKRLKGNCLFRNGSRGGERSGQSQGRSDAGKQAKDAIRELKDKMEKRKAAIEQELSDLQPDGKAAELQGQLDVAKKKSHFYKEKLKSHER